MLKRSSILSLLIIAGCGSQQPQRPAEASPAAGSAAGAADQPAAAPHTPVAEGAEGGEAASTPATGTAATDDAEAAQGTIDLPRPEGIPDDAEVRRFAGNWYAAFDEDLSWQRCKERCEEMGGHLAVVTSTEEQEFIAELADWRYLYLGATDETEEGTWVWVTGESWDYVSWFDGQPNNYGGSENYLATYDGGDWVDVDAEGDDFWMPTGFICEWETDPAGKP